MVKRKVSTIENVEFVKGNKVLFGLGFQSSFSSDSSHPTSYCELLENYFKVLTQLLHETYIFSMLVCLSKIYERFYIRPVLVLLSSIVMSVALRKDFIIISAAFSNMTSAAPSLCGVEFVFTKERREKGGAAEVMFERVTEIIRLIVACKDKKWDRY